MKIKIIGIVIVIKYEKISNISSRIHATLKGETSMFGIIYNRGERSQAFVVTMVRKTTS